MSRKREKVRAPVWRVRERGRLPRGAELVIGPLLGTLLWLLVLWAVWYVCAEWQPWLR